MPVEYQRVGAAAIAESLRPLFTRWADETPRELYAEAMQYLWSEGRTGRDASALLDRITSLPESSFDDPHFRDFYVMLGLGVLYDAVSIGYEANAPLASSDILKGPLFQLAHELGLIDRFRALRDAAERSDRSRPQGRTVEDMRARADALSEDVNAALDDLARRRGWSLNRIPRT